MCVFMFAVFWSFEEAGNVRETTTGLFPYFRRSHCSDGGGYNVWFTRCRKKFNPTVVYVGYLCRIFFKYFTFLLRNQQHTSSTHFGRNIAELQLLQKWTVKQTITFHILFRRARHSILFCGIQSTFSPPVSLILILTLSSHPKWSVSCWISD